MTLAKSSPAGIVGGPSEVFLFHLEHLSFITLILFSMISVYSKFFYDTVKGYLRNGSFTRCFVCRQKRFKDASPLLHAFPFIAVL